MKSQWLKEDGSLNLNALDELAAAVRAVTDSNASIDAVIKAAKIGAPKEIAFRCSHSGMFFPANYAKEWGRLYGIGLGDQVVSESLDSMYQVKTNHPAPEEPQDLMHPLVNSCAQVDYGVFDEEQVNSALLIPAYTDTRMAKRVEVLFQKQMTNPKSSLGLLVAQFKLLKGTK